MPNVNTSKVDLAHNPIWGGQVVKVPLLCGNL